MKMLVVLLALVLCSVASAAKPATFKENVPLAKAMLHQINKLEPQYRISEIDCRTLSPLPAMGVGVIPSQCLVIAVNGNHGMFCGVLYVDATGPQQALAFTIDHSEQYACGSVAKALGKLKLQGFVVSALVA